MRVTIMIGAHAYAVIKGDTYSMDILLSPGKAARDSLRITADELREQATKLLERAERITLAADLI